MARAQVVDGDRLEVGEFIERHWGSRIVMSRGRAFHPEKEGGFLERRDGKIAGLLTYHIDDQGMEILTLNSVLEGEGIGSSLMLNAIESARKNGCDRIWLTTTNDRLRIIDFYQRLGFRMTAINLGVVDEARKVKPQIPLVGERGVPIHDEIVMELPIEPYLD
ncbi:MAG: GNAT family N-acetyltransferase [Planctomycetes bacterium]|nr:GNAT family N-acetyltransferase [Planctomycetota bacterium]MBI3833656.1 GNAT family N-acetyltransferase [Planctomycetota bacterium]